MTKVLSLMLHLLTDKLMLATLVIQFLATQLELFLMQINLLLFKFPTFYSFFPLILQQRRKPTAFLRFLLAPTN
ncbi:hypothetical protein PPTG_23702 [Phytophthora nicotianae INRA-310]|uniref:Uncharacterized protein n=1 Tax=Phytophthora nicotianae (strain INRA-310) TaxID=761204 RepID=W2PSA5_PHYN3|nr:hypothetical protein PPTG_23702 [Phytophthora nicotianae INRA-310]ETN03823.1 hypothetical protein PPTG_23702 [Phytophthora nicotianae INRA-310]